MKIFILSFLLVSPVFAQLSADPVGPLIPHQISYQGSISVDGVPFTGTGQFKFIFLATNPLTSNPTQAIASVTSRNTGVIDEVSLSSNGSGYLVAPTVTVTGGGGSGAVLRANLSFAGSIESLTIINGGTGYTSAPTINIAPPTPAEEALWANGDSLAPIAVTEPTGSVSLAVNEGLYSVLIGGPGTTEIRNDRNPFRGDLRLRVWFAPQGTGDFQQLSPDQPIASVPFAFVASQVVGPFCNASGNYSTAMGYATSASGNSSTAMGSSTSASGDRSTTMGSETIASGDRSTAMGSETTASGFAATTMGRFTTASASRSIAMGSGSTASGDRSTAMGSNTVAHSFAETAIGSYNTSYSPSSTISFRPTDRLFGIGNGIDIQNRSDALVMLKNGRTTFEADPGATNGNFLSSYAMQIANVDATNGGDVLALTLEEIGPDVDSNFIAFFDGAGDILGEVDGSGSGGVRFQSNGADYAEYLPPLDPSETLSPGDVVAVRSGQITRETSSFDQLMVISTNPIIVGNRPKNLPDDESGHYKVAFIGQVPVKVTGPVKSGDYLLASGKHNGTAIAKAGADLRTSDRARIIGRAWDSSSGAGEKLINAAVGLDHGEALVSELNALKSRVKILEQIMLRQNSQPAGQSQSQTTSVTTQSNRRFGFSRRHPDNIHLGR